MPQGLVGKQTTELTARNAPQSPNSAPNHPTRTVGKFAEILRPQLVSRTAPPECSCCRCCRRPCACCCWRRSRGSQPRGASASAATRWTPRRRARAHSCPPALSCSLAKCGAPARRPPTARTPRAARRRRPPALGRRSARLARCGVGAHLPARRAASQSAISNALDHARYARPAALYCAALTRARPPRGRPAPHRSSRTSGSAHWSPSKKA